MGSIQLTEAAANVGVYSRYVLPRVIDVVCGAKPTTRQREKLVPGARGRVLEIGIGSGLNLPFYDAARVSALWGLDPSRELWSLARQRVAEMPLALEFLEAGAEDIPLPADSMDTVLVTYTLCSIPDVALALKDMRRVLRHDGQLLFCEHGAAPDAGVRKWQDRLNPLWQRIGGGCHLNRDIPGLLAAAGFRIRAMETMYIPGFKPASFNYWGAAD